MYISDASSIDVPDGMRGLCANSVLVDAVKGAKEVR